MQHVESHSRRSILALLASGVTATALGEATAFAAEAPNHAAIKSQFQQILDEVTKGSLTPGALLHVRRGSETWSLASGVADVSSGRLARPGDRFRAGSILKPFIATVILQLVEEGRLKLDDKITGLLAPAYTAGFADADAITVKMLLNHTSGIGEWTEAPDLSRIVKDMSHVWSADEYIALSLKQGPKFRPGAGYAYNNTEFVLLGLIIDKVTGQPWRQSVRERVFRPLGIPASALPEPGLPVRIDGHVHGYQGVDGRQVDVTTVDSSMAGAAGGHALAPTTRELAIFLDALLAGKFFRRRESLASLMDFVPTGEDGQRPVGYGLAMGRFIWPGGLTVYGHTGSTPGYRSFVMQIPERDVTIAGAVTSDLMEAMGVLGKGVQKTVAALPPRHA